MCTTEPTGNLAAGELNHLNVRGGHPALAAVGDFNLEPFAEAVQNLNLRPFMQNEYRLAVVGWRALDR